MRSASPIQHADPYRPLSVDAAATSARQRHDRHQLWGGQTVYVANWDNDYKVGFYADYLVASTEAVRPLPPPISTAPPRCRTTRSRRACSITPLSIRDADRARGARRYVYCTDPAGAACRCVGDRHHRRRGELRIVSASLGVAVPEQPELRRRVALRFGEAEVPERGTRQEASARGTLDEPLLNQKRLDDVLDRIARLR